MKPLFVKYCSRGVELAQTMSGLSITIPPLAVGEPGALVTIVTRLASSSRLFVTCTTSLKKRLSVPAPFVPDPLPLRSVRFLTRGGEVGEKCASQNSTWYLLVIPPTKFVQRALYSLMSPSGRFNCGTSRLVTFITPLVLRRLISDSGA